MNRVLTKFAVLFVLLMALTFVVGGTASAQSITATRQTVAATKIQTVGPECSFSQRSNWETSYGVNIIKWQSSCGGVHCEAIDNFYNGGGLQLVLKAFNASGTLVAFTSAAKDPFVPGNSFNTSALSGHSSYTCNPSRI